MHCSAPIERFSPCCWSQLCGASAVACVSVVAFLALHAQSAGLVVDLPHGTAVLAELDVDERDGAVSDSTARHQLEIGAPASAIITMLNCMETWPSGLTKERDRVSREMRAPRVSCPRRRDRSCPCRRAP